MLTEEDIKKFDEPAQEQVEEAVKFADESPFPDLASLYDDIYVMEQGSPNAWWSVDERSPAVHAGEEEREAPDIAHELAEAGAAYARTEDDDEKPRRPRVDRAEPEDEGEGEPEEEQG